MTRSPTELVVLEHQGRFEPAFRIDGWRLGYTGQAPYYVLTTRGTVYRLPRSGTSSSSTQILPISEFSRMPLVEQIGYLDEDRLCFPLIVPFYKRGDGRLITEIGRLAISAGSTVRPLCFGWSHARGYRASRDVDYMHRQVSEWAEEQSAKTGARLKLFFCTPNAGTDESLHASVPFNELIAAGLLSKERVNALG